MIEPRDKGLILWTLRFGDEVRDESSYFKGLDAKPDPKMLKLVGSLIEAHTQPWSPKLVEDPVQDKILDLIKARQNRGRKPEVKSKDEGQPRPASNVVDLMAALKRSLGQQSAEAKRRKG